MATFLVKILNVTYNRNIGTYCVKKTMIKKFVLYFDCAADFSLLNLPKGKSLGRSKPATNS